MILPASRLFFLLSMLAFICPAVSHAEPITLKFTAQIGAGNNLDTDNVFGEGAGANLSGQVITGSVTIDPALLTPACQTGAACYSEIGAGAISVSFGLNGITSTVASTGSMLINDTHKGRWNYLGVSAANADFVQQSIGALFDTATLFDAYGDPATAIASLASIADGTGLVKGGITYMSADGEHLDATILTIDVPEPAALPLLAAFLVLLTTTRRF